MAEDDYKYSVDIACNSDDKAYREWATNIKSNEYCISTLLAVWSSLILSHRTNNFFCVFLIDFKSCTIKRLLEKAGWQ